MAAQSVPAVVAAERTIPVEVSGGSIRLDGPLDVRPGERVAFVVVNRDDVAYRIGVEDAAAPMLPGGHGDAFGAPLPALGTTTLIVSEDDPAGTVLMLSGHDGTMAHRLLAPR